MNFSFLKQDRIRKGREYTELKRSGKVFKTKMLVFNYAESERTKLGVIVTKKVGNSVERNRIKRWIREVFRLEKSVFSKPVDIVIIPRRSDMTFSSIRKDFIYFAGKQNEISAD